MKLKIKYIIKSIAKIDGKLKTYEPVEQEALCDSFTVKENPYEFCTLYLYAKPNFFTKKLIGKISPISEVFRIEKL